MPSDSIYGSLYRLERILKCETNVDQKLVNELLGFCQQRLMDKFDQYERVVVKEMFAMSFQKFSYKDASYDEYDQVTAKINDFKASLNKLLKIKGQQQIGDHERFE